MKIGVFGVRGGWSTEKMVEAIRRYGVDAVPVYLQEAVYSVHNGKCMFHGDDLGGFDAFVVKKLGPSEAGSTPLRVNILEMLADRGIPIFSSPSALRRVINRYDMTVALARAGVPIPDTVVTEDVLEALKVVSAWGMAVYKPLLTSKGRGMLLFDGSHRDQARLILEEKRDKGELPFYLQRFIPHGGKDIGVAVLDGRFVAAYARVQKNGGWQTTTAAGGQYAPAKPSDRVIEVAEKAASVFGLTFTVVDVVESPTGPLVYEASAFGGFRGLLEANNVDMADLYAAYVVEQLKGAACAKA